MSQLWDCWQLMGLPGQLQLIAMDELMASLRVGHDAFMACSSGLTVIVNGGKVVCVRDSSSPEANELEMQLLQLPLGHYEFSMELVPANVEPMLRIAYAIVILRGGALLRSRALELLSQPVRDCKCYIVLCIAAWCRMQHGVAALAPIQRMLATNMTILTDVPQM